MSCRLAELLPGNELLKGALPGCPGSQGLLEEGTQPEPKAWERIAVRGELVPAEQAHILVDSMMSQSWLVGELLGQARWLWDTG